MINFVRSWVDDVFCGRAEVWRLLLLWVIVNQVWWGNVTSNSVWCFYRRFQLLYERWLFFESYMLLTAIYDSVRGGGRRCWGGIVIILIMNFNRCFVLSLLNKWWWWIRWIMIRFRNSSIFLRRFRRHHKYLIENHLLPNFLTIALWGLEKLLLLNLWTLPSKMWWFHPILTIGVVIVNIFISTGCIQLIVISIILKNI